VRGKCKVENAVILLRVPSNFFQSHNKLKLITTNALCNLMDVRPVKMSYQQRRMVLPFMETICQTFGANKETYRGSFTYSLPLSGF